MNQTTRRSSPARRRLKAVGATTAIAGLAFCTSVLSAGPASAGTFCGATATGGFGCSIEQPDGSYNLYLSTGEIIYGW